MPCMKCGRETKDGQTFCSVCLTDMEKYPVKAGTPIQLPYRQDVPIPKKRTVTKKRKVKPEEQVRQLRFKLRWVSLALVITILAFVLSVVGLLHLLDERDQYQRSRIGQNYTVTSSDHT